MNRHLVILACLLLACAGPSGGQGQEQQPLPATQPMVLGAASNFSQGWREPVARGAAELGVVHFRDGMRWPEVERRAGRFEFNSVRATYPARLAAQGGQLVLTVNFGNPLYDGGHTPHSAQALEAFGAFVASVVERYPAITAVEVGNEFNSANFTSGPVREAGIARRAGYHLAMVQAVERALRRVRPEVELWGGSTHSLPAGYLWPVLDGGAAHMQALAVHPYTTPVDQLAAQIGVLRRHPAASAMPLAVTEFASRDPEHAADDLLRGYAALAALGVRAMYWYPLSERGDGTVPLLTREGQPTVAAEGFRLVQRLLATRIARDISPDAFTRVIAFGDDVLVAWGEPRALQLAREDITALDARGREVPRAGLALSATAPLILHGGAPLRLGTEVLPGCSTLIADSFYQFAYPGGPGPVPGIPHFASSVRIGSRELAWETLPGQQRAGVPWNPYLGLSAHPAIRLLADGMALGGVRGEEVAVIHHYVADRARRLRLEARFTAAEGSRPLAISIGTGQVALHAGTTARPLHFDSPVELQAGESLRVAAVAAAGQRGANASYRLRMHDSSLCGA